MNAVAIRHADLHQDRMQDEIVLLHLILSWTEDDTFRLNHRRTR